MEPTDRHIIAAYWTRPGAGCVLLARDWKASTLPPLKVRGKGLKIRNLRPMDGEAMARFTGYHERGGRIEFCLDPRRFPHVDFDHDPVRVAGPFNDWGRADDAKDFEMRRRQTGDGPLLGVSVDRERVVTAGKRMTFKFVTRSWHWLTPLRCAPNFVEDKTGNPNYALNPAQTGRHAFVFDVGKKRGMDQAATVAWDDEQEHLIEPGLGFYDLATGAPLGSCIENGDTVFRLFAPRATRVRLEVFDDLENPSPQRFDLELMEDQLTWEVVLRGNLHGWYYRYFVDGPDDGRTTNFDFTQPLLDPWARAVTGPVGPAIVFDPARAGIPGARHQPPRWEDLAILECHVRDLVARAPVDLTGAERRGFRGVTRFLADPTCYLHNLGVNTLEFQPVQQFDSTGADDYHWGYMTNNYFAPCAWYGTEPAAGSQNAEFREMVAACHEHGLSVLVDVVYNHVGEPPNLLFIDKAYYFHVDHGGGLINWSGTGNVLRAESAMALRLIIDSLVHLVEAYDVDGFRFDLAELLGIEALKRIGDALRAVKPSVVLVAEPWSFRGSIQWDSRMAGFAFWNDGFREFLKEYVRGHGNADGLYYFVKGSLDHMAAWPSQSVNYVESHDDRTWIDDITENADHNGEHPAHNDVLRTHIMAALLYTSVGIPLIACGQDFLRSKRGVRNTYQDADLNALDYHRIEHFGQTHFYFRQWIAFRRSEWGKVLRLDENPGPGYLRVFKCENGDRSAAALLFNADLALGPRQILLALNPHFDEARIHLHDTEGDGWQELADVHNFNFDGIMNGRLDLEGRDLNIGPMDLGLWVREGGGS